MLFYFYYDTISVFYALSFTNRHSSYMHRQNKTKQNRQTNKKNNNLKERVQAQKDSKKAPCKMLPSRNLQAWIGILLHFKDVDTRIY